MACCLVEFEAHDCAFRSGVAEAAEAEIVEQFLPTDERIRGPPLGSRDGPTLDGQGAMPSRELDRGPHQGMSNPLRSVIGPDEQAWQQPHNFVLVAVPVSQEFASSSFGDRVSRPGTKCAPADRLTRYEGKESPAGISGAAEQLRKICQGIWPDGPSVDMCRAHSRTVRRCDGSWELSGSMVGATFRNERSRMPVEYPCPAVSARRR
jgi:hypothetical protein